MEKARTVTAVLGERVAQALERLVVDAVGAQGEVDFLGGAGAMGGEEDDGVGDDLAALFADLQRAGDADRLVGGEVDLGSCGRSRASR